MLTRCVDRKPWVDSLFGMLDDSDECYCPEGVAYSKSKKVKPGIKWNGKKIRGQKRSSGKHGGFRY